MKNNRSTTVYSSKGDIIRKAKMLKESSDIVLEDISNATIQDIQNTLELLHASKEYVKQGAATLKSNKTNWSKQSNPGNKKHVEEKLKELKDINFFDVVTNKINSSEQLMRDTVEFNNKINHSNQKGSANESIDSFKKSFDNFQSLIEQAGDANSKDRDRWLIAWDTETTGATNLEGIWHPDSITELSVMQKNLNTKQIENTTIALGITKEEKETILKEIKEAIKDGTLESNERLRVSAMRYSLYGDDAVTFEEVADKGYYKFSNFIDADKHEMYNVKKIEKGLNKFVAIGDQTKILDNGVRADHYYAAQIMQDSINKIKDNKAMLLGQNDNLFDTPIYNNFLMKMNKLYKDKTDMFNFDLDLNSEQTLDLLGGLQLFTNYNNASKLYPGKDISDVKKLRGQEYIIQKHYQEWFTSEGLKPHLAEDDVKALLAIATEDSELLGESVLNYIGENLKNVESKTKELELNKSILQAKKGRSGAFQGKGFLNFASNSEGEIFTSGNYVIDGNKVDGLGFNAGFGINKDMLYEVNSVNKYKVNDELREKIGSLMPEYSGKNLYHVELSMLTNGHNSRPTDLKQHLFFKTQKEMVAALSGEFDLVAERDGEGFKILDGFLDRFDTRQIDEIKGEAVFKDINSNHKKTHTELVNEKIDFNINKLVTSRAENSLLQDTSYNKAVKIKTLKERLNKELGLGQDVIIKQRELNDIMAGRVCKGNTVLSIQENVDKAKDIVFNTLKHNDTMTKLLPSTIDNYSTAMDYMNANEGFINTVLDTLEPIFSNKKMDQFDPRRQYLYQEVVSKIKEQTAFDIYDGKHASARLALGDKKLEASMDYFKNLYEVKLDELNSRDAVKQINYHTSEEFQNILKIDLNNTKAYKVVNAATDMVWGENYKGIASGHKNIAMENLFNLLNQDDKLAKTNSFKDIAKEYEFNVKQGKFTNKGFNAEDIADRIMEGMREVKSKDKTAGVLNVKGAFMKSIEAHSGFTSVLNSKDFLDSLPDKIKEIVDNTNVKVYNGINKEQAANFVEHNLMKHYMPDLDVVKQGFNWEKGGAQEILYNNTRKDIKDYLSDVVYNINNLGMDLYVQNNGDLLLDKNGVVNTLDFLPKIKYNEEASTMYLNIRSQNFQLNNKLDFKSTGSSIKGTAETSISSINKFTNSKRIRNIAQTKGTSEAIDNFFASLAGDVSKLRQGSTINGFSGNDIDSNFNVDASEMKKVLYDLFGSHGKKSKTLNGVDLMDKDLKEIMKTYLDRLKDDDLKDWAWDPAVVRDMSKDFTHILQAISNETEDVDFKFLANNFNLTGKDKNTTKVIGSANPGVREINSAWSAHDNVQRPTIVQAANAIPLRVKNIKENPNSVVSGTLISNSSVDNKMIRNLKGVGETTTDVMLDIKYMGTNSLQVLMDTNFEDVIKKASVEFNSEKAAAKTYLHLRSTLSTFEQERIMDSRIHEQVFGLTTAATQKLSKNLDILAPTKDMNLKESREYFKTLNDVRGKVKVVNGELKFESSIGKYVKKGENILNTKGYSDALTPFASKMTDGVFSFNYYNEEGLKLTDSEISKIINKEKNLLLKGRDRLKGNQAESSVIIEDILKRNKIKGQYAIEDISALGYAKTMTGGAEKGMTDIVYATTGQHNEKIKKVFEELGVWDQAKNKVLTEEGTDALLLYGAGSKKKLNKILKDNNFDMSSFKSAMSEERHKNSKLFFDHLLGGSAHMIANDNVVGHRNIGQMYSGILSDSIDMLNNSEAAKKANKTGSEIIADLINSNEKFQFNVNRNLNNGKQTAVEAIAKGNKLQFGEMGSTLDNLSQFDSQKFISLIKEIDKTYFNGKSGLYHDNAYYRDDKGILSEKGKEFVGRYDFEMEGDKKVLKSSITKDSVKYVRDPETQTSIDYEYFALKQQEVGLRKRKIELQQQASANKKIKDGANKSLIEDEIRDINTKLDSVRQRMSSYDTVSKSMSMGDQELAIIERIAITDIHANQVKDLMLSDDKTILEADSLKGRFVKTEENDIILDNRLFKQNLDSNDIHYKKYEGTRVLDPFVQRLKEKQFYDKDFEELLTDKNITEEGYTQYKDIYERLNNRGIKVSKEKAEEIMQADLAMKATSFNKKNKTSISLNTLTGEDIHESLRYDIKHIGDLQINAEQIADKNIVLDLGKEFNQDRYLAMPGIGDRIGDTEIKTAYQTKLRSLQSKYKEYDAVRGTDEADEIFQKIVKQKDEMVGLVEKSIYGKNNLLHQMSKIELGMPAVRAKASGVIVNQMTDDMKDAFKKFGINNVDEYMPTNKAMIDGKSIAKWAEESVDHDYAFVSLETMKKAGYLSDDRLKQLGKTEEEMIDFLKTHGTFALSDRFPNTRTGSINATRIFLDDELTGNQIKMSLPAMLKSNADHDGDSYSNAYMQKIVDGKVEDGVLYSHAKVEAINSLKADSLEINNTTIRNKVKEQGIISMESFDEYDELQAYMTLTGGKENQRWIKEAQKKIVEDSYRNVAVNDIGGQGVIKPGSNSIFGKVNLGALSEMPEIGSFNDIEKHSNEIINQAKELLEQGHTGGLKAKDLESFRNIETIRDGKSIDILDSALSIIEEGKANGKVAEDIFKSFENTALKKISIDNNVQEIMAKTGLAATGNVNVALNSIKLAAQMTEKSTNDIMFTNFAWDVLDVAEQGVISSKKMKDAGFDNKTISGFTNAMNEMFNKGNTQEGSKLLKEWLGEHAVDTFDKSFDLYGKEVLGEAEYNAAYKYQQDLKALKDNNKNITQAEIKAKLGDRKSHGQFMEDHFMKKMNEYAINPELLSINAANNAIGRNGEAVMENIERAGAAAAMENGSLKSNLIFATGRSDEKALEAAYAEMAQQSRFDVEKRAAVIKKHEQRIENGSGVVKATTSFADDMISAISKGPLLSTGSGLTGAALGLAAGLMVSGYASGNPLNDKSAQQVSQEQSQQPVNTMSVPQFMEQGGFATGNSQQGYVINLTADTKKGKKYMQKMMAKAAEASVGGAVSVNMNIRNGREGNITDRDIENFIDRHL